MSRIELCDITACIDIFLRKTNFKNLMSLRFPNQDMAKNIISLVYISPNEELCTFLGISDKSKLVKKNSENWILGVANI